MTADTEQGTTIPGWLLEAVCEAHGHAFRAVPEEISHHCARCGIRWIDMYLATHARSDNASSVVVP